MEEKRIAVDGVTSSVFCAGDERSTEAVVFVHGNPGPSDDFHYLLPQIAAFARVIAPDMPGFGRADRARDFDYTAEGFARHLDGILRALSIERVHLVLHDLGGAWGFQWAIEHTARVKSVALINVGIMPDYRWHSLARIWRTPIVGELFQLLASKPRVRHALNANNPRPFPDAFLDRVTGFADWGHKRAVLKFYRATSDPGGRARAAIDAVKSLRLPALVLWGDGDPFVPVKFAESQKQYFDAEVHILEGCGHWPMVDDPEKVASLLMPFLRRQGGSPRSFTASS
ncbi:MAG TPA: alpha/beta hydrolase [Nevskiaceae bacterium]|nr:alpha/beta hydrolase [Nevskiaceae bacterium]